MDPPAGLPDWHALRDWTLEAVADRSSLLGSLLPKLTEIDMLSASGKKGMTPELVASVISSISPGYFDSLRILEGGTPNSNHKAIARLAKLGVVRHIVTTNFDVFIEMALEEEGLPYRAIRTEEEFALLPIGTDLVSPGLCVFKIHGCLTLPDTITATLERQARGLSGSRLLALKWLQRSYQFVYWGYSGWDLKINLDYLGTVSVADKAPGFIWSLHQNDTFTETPSPYVLRLADHYGDRALVGHRLAPSVARSLLTSGGIPYPPQHKQTATERASWSSEKGRRLRDGLARWATEHINDVEAILIFGRLLEVLGEHGKALTLYAQIQRMGEEQKDVLLTARGLLSSGSIHEKTGCPTQALESYRRAEEIARSADKFTILAESLNSQASVLARLGYAGESLSRCKQAIGFFRGKGTFLSAARCAENMGAAYEALHRLEDAVQFLEQAEKDYRHIGERYALCGCLNKLGIIYRNWGEWDRAHEYFTECHRITKEMIGDRSSAEEARLLLASIEVAKNKGESVYQDLLSVESFAREAGLPDLLRNAQQYLAIVESNRGNMDRAFELGEELIQFARQEKSTRMLVSALLNHSHACLSRGDVQGTLKQRKEALDMSRASNNPFMTARALEEVGRLYQEHLSEPATAVKYYQAAISSYRNSEYSEFQFIPSLLGRIATCEKRPRQPPVGIVRSLLDKDPLIAEGLRHLSGNSSDQDWPQRLSELMDDPEDLEGPVCRLALQMQMLAHDHQEDPERSIEYLSAALRLAKAVHYNQMEASLRCDIGWQEVRGEKFADGIAMLEEAVRLSKAMHDIDSEIIHTGNLGFAIARSGDEPRGYRVLEDAVQLARKSNNRFRLNWLLREHAEHFKSRRDRRAIPYFEEAISLAEEDGNVKLLSELHFNLGEVYYDTGNYEQAFQHRLRGLYLLRAYSDDKSLEFSRLLVIATLCETKLNRLEEAVDYYDQAIGISYHCMGSKFIDQVFPNRQRAYNALPKPSTLPHELYDRLHKFFGNDEVTNGILVLVAAKGGFQQSWFEPRFFSRVFAAGQSIEGAFGDIVIEFAMEVERRGQRDMADTELKVAEVTALESGDKRLLAKVRRHRGDLLAKRGLPDASLQEYEKALSFVRLVDDSLEIDMISYAMAELKFQRGDADKALEHIAEALEAAKSAKYRRGMAHDLYKKAEILEHLGRIEEATLCLDDAIPILRETSLFSQFVGANLLLARLHCNLAHPDKSLFIIESITDIVEKQGTAMAKETLDDVKARAIALQRAGR